MSKGYKHEEGIRVAPIKNVVATSFRHDAMPLTWSDVIVGTGSVAYQVNSGVKLSLAASGDSVIRATRHRVPASPNAALVGSMAIAFNAPVAGVVKRVGLFDANSGVFFEQDGTGLYLVKRSSETGSPVDERVPISSASEDRLNGAGPSGLVWDPTVLQVLHFEIKWPGTAMLGLEWSDRVRPIHVFRVSSAQAAGFASDALPMRIEISGSAVADMVQYSSSISAAGGSGFLSEPGQLYSAVNASPVTLDNTTLTPVLSLRMASQFSGKPNQKIAVPMLASLSCPGQSVLMRLIYNGTLTGPSFSSIFPYSGMEQDSVATVIAGGLPVYANVGDGVIQGNIKQLDGRYPMAYNEISGQGDILTIAATLLTGTSASAWGTVVWKEI